MVTLEDMQTALMKAHGEKTQLQARLRMAAAELVSCYRDSLGVPAEKSHRAVSTGVLRNDEFIAVPVASMLLNKERQLQFYLSTTISDHHMSRFVVSLSISMSEEHEFISVKVGDNVPALLVLKEGVEERFAESIEAIKQTVLEKIDYLA
ncbi:hypothetical protein I7V27_22730 [Lelliottia amnigena]|uniref:Uncharacterized protein n=1 Tax=Lelliottia amnigena TaxID=61646 RepID=A0AAP2AIB7_LELAM|nr:hypothetical protein [Lelliottia amnigena]MBL5901713.1 hypothetical protein [Lelliottia amnigena]MBL5937235.1 hypothetical protein [Lelliottia amnigena]